MLYITIIVAVGSFAYFWRWLAGGKCESNAGLHGKTVIITGSNTGIGKETARDLVRRGARVILACRNLDKATKAAADIEPNSRGEIVVRQLDLASFKSVRNFAKEILESENRVDILVNNAGIVSSKKKSEDGNDLLFQSNHLGHFLLTNLLLEKIKRSPCGRIVNVASDLHYHGKMHWDDLNLDKAGSYSGLKAYSQSKVANVLFTKELAKRLKETSVKTYCLHPGVVKTDINKDMWEVWPFLFSVFLVVFNPFFKNCEQGAQTTIYCAVSEEVEKQSGLYYSDCAVKKPSKEASSDEAAKKLWDISAKMVGL